MSKEYYYVDITIKDLKIIDWGVSNTATHTGKTDTPSVYRMFLPKGQFNKLTKRIADAQ